MAADDAVASDADADAERPRVRHEVGKLDLLVGFGHEGMKIMTGMFGIPELGYILDVWRVFY